MTWLDKARTGQTSPQAPARAQTSLFPRKGGTVLDLNALRGAAGRAARTLHTQGQDQ